MAARPRPPQNRRALPENRRSRPTPARVPLRARLLVLRERLRARLPRLQRAGAWASRALLVAAVAAGLAAGVQLVARHMQTSPAFATKTISVHGASHLSHDEVARLAGLAIGRNVFETSPSKARERLSREPWIAAASVRRRLPATFEISVRERRAVALLAQGALYLVDEGGVAFKALAAGDPADLPIVTGISAEETARDLGAATSALRAAVSLLHEYASEGLSRRAPVSEIHFEADLGLALYVGGDATYVRLGKAPFAAKLRRFREVLRQLQGQRERAQYVYLDNQRRPDRVTVRLR